LRASARGHIAARRLTSSARAFQDNRLPAVCRRALTRKPAYDLSIMYACGLRCHWSAIDQTPIADR